MGLVFFVLTERKMSQIVKLSSGIDASVNTVIDGDFETRFVVRPSTEQPGKDDIIIYLSSARGCAQSCRMCWLTQTGQTDETPATLEDFIRQAQLSFSEAEKYVFENQRQVASMHYNFMARGEPLLNPIIRNDFKPLGDALIAQATKFLDAIGEVQSKVDMDAVLSGENDALFDNIDVKFKISTIMAGIYVRNEAGTIVDGLEKLDFGGYLPEIYYSIYSMSRDFRKRWLPKAEDPQDALRLLAAYHRDGGPVRFHSAFIFAHNDEIGDIREVVKAINFFALPKKFNIVRYNSPDETKSQEAPEEHLEAIATFLREKEFEVQMVSRVGTDVMASCGQFINSKEL